MNNVLVTLLQQLNARTIDTRNHIFMHPLYRIKGTSDVYAPLPGWEVVGWVAIANKVALVYKCHIAYEGGQFQKGKLYWRRLTNKHIFLRT